MCFGLLGPWLHQVDIPWILSWTLAYLFGMNISLEYHCAGAGWDNGVAVWQEALSTCALLNWHSRY